MIKGIKASDGIAIGKAFIYSKPEITLVNAKVEDTEKELKYFLGCIEKSKEELNKLISVAKNEEQKEILNTHLMLTEDVAIIDEVSSKIKDGTNAETALTEVVENFVAMFEAIDDEYLKARASDLKDVYTRLIYAIKGVELVSFDTLEQGSIIIAEDLLASDTVKVNWDLVSGFATNLGSKTSHTVIIAKNMDIPCVVGMKSNDIKNGDLVVIDGFKGEVHVNPSKEEVESFEKQQKKLKEEAEVLEKVIGLETKTASGVKVSLAMNCGNVEEVKRAFDRNADGIGLFRTEFMYMQNDHFPTEEEQFKVYKEILELGKGKPVIVRTLDIGGDKNLPYYEFETEENPFLGLRGIRLCFKMRDIFKTQLRALVRASVYGNLEVMLPMIVSVEEVTETKKMIEEIKAELKAEGIEYKDFKVGIMIETPASVFIADKLAENVDFFSIGTNDLTQYVLSTDRGNESVSYLYDSTNLAVLRAIEQTIKAANKAGIACSMCGEFAGDEKYTDLLLNIGLRKFSVSYSKFPKVKNNILNLDVDENFTL